MLLRRECWKTEERRAKKKATLSESKAMHEETFLCSCLRDEQEVGAKGVDDMSGRKGGGG